MLNRRQALTLGGLGAGVLAMPKLLSPRSEEFHAEAATADPPPYDAFATPMPLPSVLRPSTTTGGTDVYQLDIAAGTAELLPGYQTPIFAYGNRFVGPVIRARRDRPVAVRFRNRLTVPTNVHLHGGHTPAEHDGHPMDLIQPGEALTYRYPNAQQAATLWYHAHSHHTEAEHVYRGLHGFYLLSDDEEARLRLPSGRYDVPIMLRDAKFDEQANLIHALEDPAVRSTILVNGRAKPYFAVEARKYRLRLLNSANERVLRLSLDGATFHQIGSDGGLLPAPKPRTQLQVTSGERADVVVDFSRYPIGTQLMLTDSVKGDLLRFDVAAAPREPDRSRLLSRLGGEHRLATPTAERDVVFRFEFPPDAAPRALVNDRTFDADRVDFTIRRGTTEVWNLINADDPIGLHHNFHMHLAQFQVLERDGGAPGPDDIGWKDTVYLPPGARVKVQATFRSYLGRYMYHCHFIEHSSLGMMAQMEIVP